ncbi:MAG TPA: nitrophenyl compound nitroreductase subunit ArsF family protein [Planctomycetota bacterium]
MNARNLVTSLLLVVVFGSLGVFAWQRGMKPPATVPAEPATNAADVLVTYFTTNVRCVSCRTIEELTRRAVAEGFPAELAAGKVVFRVVNTDLPEHQHFVDHYTITNKTVVVSHQRDGREVEWTGRQDVWLHFGEPETFFTYVREPIRSYLAAK